MKDENISDFIDIDTLAQKLNVPKSRIYSETRRRGGNTIPMLRIGKYCRFVLPEVVEFFRKQTKEAA